MNNEKKKISYLKRHVKTCYITLENLNHHKSVIESGMACNILEDEHVRKYIERQLNMIENRILKRKEIINNRLALIEELCQQETQTPLC